MVSSKSSHWAWLPPMRCISCSTGSKWASAPAWSPAANAAVPCTSGSTTRPAIGLPLASSARRPSIIFVSAASSPHAA